MVVRVTNACFRTLAAMVAVASCIVADSGAAKWLKDVKRSIPLLVGMAANVLSEDT